MSFEIALKKGDLGECIITKILEDKGWVVYRPFTKDKAHYFDMLCTKNKDKIIAIDIKTKARLNNWNAQGINIKSYDQYINFVKTTNINFYLIFIDDKLGYVHMIDITKLKNPIYPNNEIIAWEVSQMKHIYTLCENDIKELTKYDQRKYNFNPNEQRK